MTIGQARAQHAADQVNAVPNHNQGDYRQLARKLPAMLVTLGIGQTVAFLRAKQSKTGKPQNAHRLLLNSLASWLLGSESLIAWRPYQAAQPAVAPQPTGEWLQQRLCTCSSVGYYQALEEALSYAGWLKRFAEAQELEQ